MESPLSGQRVFHRDWLPLIQSLKAERFGIETEMNLRFIEAGASILEVETEMSHREMGKSLKGLCRYKETNYCSRWSNYSLSAPHKQPPPTKRESSNSSGLVSKIQVFLDKTNYFCIITEYI